MIALTLVVMLSLQAPLGPETPQSRRLSEVVNEVYKLAEKLTPKDAAGVIDPLKKYLVDPDFDPMKYPEKSRERGLAATIRGIAQYHLAEAYEASGQYELAIAAYQDSTEKHRIPSWCGNAVAGNHVAARLGQGRCLERLGRYREALDRYFQACNSHLLTRDGGAARRIVAIHERAGTIPALRNDLAQRERREVDRLTKELAKQPDPSLLEAVSPVVPVRRILELRDAEQDGRWKDLIGALDHTMLEEDVAADAAARLSRHATTTVPLLTAELDREPDNARGITCALGLCATPEAIKALAKVSGKSGGRRDMIAVIYALKLSGAAGVQTLIDLQNSDPIFKLLSDRTPQGLVEDRFPPLPKTLKLD